MNIGETVIVSLKLPSEGNGTKSKPVENKWEAVIETILAKEVELKLVKEVEKCIEFDFPTVVKKANMNRTQNNTWEVNFRVNGLSY